MSTTAESPPKTTTARSRDPGRWKRRAVTIPSMFLLAAVVVAITPVALPLAFLVDLVRPRRFALTRCVFFFFGYLVGEVTFISFAALQWLVTLPLGRWGRALMARWAQPYGRAWGLYLDGFGRWCFGVKLDVTGQDALVSGGPVIAFLRHASVADNLFAPRFFGQWAGLDLLYVAKAELQNDPIFDIIGNRIGACFVKRGSDDSEREIAAVTDLLDGIGPKDAIMVYPEGTRFTPEKRAKILASIERRGDAATLERAKRLRHVLPPNPRGPVALLEKTIASGSPVDVVFCFHAGYEGAATFADLHQGRANHRHVRVHFVRYTGRELPTGGREALTEWLWQRWEELDRFVDVELPGVLGK